MIKEANGYVHGLLTKFLKISSKRLLKVNFDEWKVVRKDCEKVKEYREKKTIIIILCKCDQFN